MATHYELVQGLPMPPRLGGHPALDLCNTWAGWDGRTPGEYLKGYDELAVWSGHVGLLPARRVAALREEARRHPRTASSVVERTRRFRAALYPLLLRRPGGKDGTEPVAREVRAAASAAVLHEAGEGFRWGVDEDAGLAVPLLAAAWSAADLLTAPELLASVHACPGSGCGWLFLDRRGRRRWCSMATCGNRDKVNRFAARKRVEGTQRTQHR